MKTLLRNVAVALGLSVVFGLVAAEAVHAGAPQKMPTQTLKEKELKEKELLEKEKRLKEKEMKEKELKEKELKEKELKELKEKELKEKKETETVQPTKIASSLASDKVVLGGSLVPAARPASMPSRVVRAEAARAEAR